MSVVLRLFERCLRLFRVLFEGCFEVALRLYGMLLWGLF